MILGLIAGTAGLVVALVKGGRIAAVVYTPVRLLWLVPVALACQVATTVESVSVSPALLLLGANVILLTFLIRNWSYAGIAFAAFGLVLNSLVIGLNGAMPVSIEAAAVAGLTTEDIKATAPEHVADDDGTRLLWLGDVIPLPKSNLVVSIGDLFLALGIARFLYSRAFAGIENGPVNRFRAGEGVEV